MTASEVGSANSGSELIYHYTTPLGLKGIIEGKSIWATDVWYMNDTREATFGFDVIEAYLRSKLASEDSRAHQFAEAALKAFEDIRKNTDKLPNSYIACFSKNDDQLSQWRGYGASGGFSIGFKRTALEHASSSTDFTHHTIREVIYKQSHQFMALDSHYAREVAPNLDDNLNAVVSTFIVWALVLSPALKNHAFKEEAEVRLHLFRESGDSSLNFRMSLMGLTPYVNVALWTDEMTPTCPIQEIIIGPTTYPDLAHRSVQQLLTLHGLSDVKLRFSEVPLRP